QRLKLYLEQAPYLHSDETRWRMLEGDERTGWQLWGFVAGTHCYYEAKDTRAGEVICEFLTHCKATHVISDAYQGYGRGVRKAGKRNGYCNAHARRYFADAEQDYAEAVKPVLELYDRIYLIERELKTITDEATRLQIRRNRTLP